MPVQTIHPKGSPSAQVWVVVNDPYPQDADKGYLFSAGYGYTYDKMLSAAGLSNVYICCRRPDVGDKNSYRILENDLNHYKPPIIIALEEAGKWLCPELQKRVTKAKGQTEAEYESEIEKYSGSLLTSGLLNYPHFVVPSFAPDTVVKNWKLRDIVVSLELGKVRSELDYFNTHQRTLEPLPSYTFETDFDGPDGFAKLMYILESFKSSKLLSNDIETVYPKKGDKQTRSEFYGKTPGYPILVGLANNSRSAISFELFRQDLNETVALWRSLDWLLRNVQQLGQNIINFDESYYEMLGFELGMPPIDTLIRHHVLWPELKHKLAFLTKQYTRQPYYKGMGANWRPTKLQEYKHYNCLDCAVTYKVYEEQELEFNDRPYLR